MKSLLSIAVFLIFCSLSLQAQVGIRANYHALNVPTWERLVQTASPEILGSSLNTMGYSIGLDYWFRLKDYRIEFFPEVGYSSLATVNQTDNSFQWNQYFTKLNTHFYVLDFEEDCDCPTFSKQSPWFKKGFFFSIMVGGGYSNMNSIGPMSTAYDEWNLLASMGVGLDIGISDFITLTPTLQWAHWITPEWQGISYNTDVQAEKAPASAVSAGVRVGIRFPTRYY